MKYKSSLALIVSLFAIVLLSGCASSGGTHEYNQDQSRAWNLTESVGMTQMEDSEVPADQVEGHLMDLVGVAVDANMFMTNARFAMNFSDALGLSLLGLLADNDAHSERDTIIAWIPSTEAKNREEAHVWLREEMHDATVQAISDLGMELETEFHNRRTDVWGSSAYDDTKIHGRKEDGAVCSVFVRTYPTLISEQQSIPGFIAPDASGYQARAGDKIIYPTFDVSCSDKPRGKFDLDKGLELTSEISRNLPKTVFLYSRMLQVDDQKLPPIVHDHGKALLFLIKED